MERHNVQPLTSADILSVAYIEGKAYPNNMTEGIVAMQNRIIAGAIANQIHARENLSLKYVDPGNIVKGYIVAHEGRQNSETVIYIEDLAVLPGSRIAGGRLINAFAENYINNYIAKGKMMPIFMQAREETSYRILQRQLESISEKLGVQFNVEEGNEYQYGDSTMHGVTLRPRKI